MYAGSLVSLVCPAIDAGAAPPAPAHGTCCDLGEDVTPRIYHRAGLIFDGRVLVSGGTRIRALGQTLESIDRIAFIDPDSGAVTESYQVPGNDGKAARVAVPRLAVARSNHTQTTLADGRVLFVGGLTGAAGTSPGAPTETVEWFDPFTGEMHAGPDMSAPRAGHTATELTDGRVVVAGGGSWQVFDPASMLWSTPYPLRLERKDHAAVRLEEDRVLLIGGRGVTGATMEVINVARGSSRLTDARLRVAVDDVAAAMLASGDVLIVGGQDVTTGNTGGWTYRYDPARDVLTALPSPPARANGIADHQLVTRGPCAFVFGGEQQVDGVDRELDYVAVFDARTDRWHRLPPMGSAHDDFAAVPLDDGRVMIIGGGVPFFGIELPSSRIEIFTPTITPSRDDVP